MICCCKKLEHIMSTLFNSNIVLYYGTNLLSELVSFNQACGISIVGGCLDSNNDT